MLHPVIGNAVSGNMTFYVSPFVLFVFLLLSVTVKNIHVGLVVAGFDLAFMLVRSANPLDEIVSFVRVARGRTFPLLFPHLCCLELSFRSAEMLVRWNEGSYGGEPHGTNELRKHLLNVGSEMDLLRDGLRPRSNFPAVSVDMVNIKLVVFLLCANNFIDALLNSFFLED